MDPPLKNNATIEDIINTNNMNRHADRNIDKDLFKIISTPKLIYILHNLNNVFKI